MKAFTNWLLTRGVLYALTQAPIFAVLFGFFFKLIPFHYANFAVMLSFLALPGWVAYRIKVSTDKDEPAHHLYRYALYAIVPCAIFSVVRIPMALALNFPYWHPWFEFGHSLTGEPLNQFSSLIPGAVLYTLQGTSLGLGFYILFRRHSFINAVLYLCVYLSSLYCYVFPEYGRVGIPTPPVWHFIAWWAHFFMAVAAWYMPIFVEKHWPRVRSAGKMVVASVLAVMIILPYGFAFVRAQAWQFPKQHAIDLQTLNQPNLVSVKTPPHLVTNDHGLELQFDLRFGPRAYKNFVNKVRDIDAQNVEIFGRISVDGQTVALCARSIKEIESPNNNDRFAPDYLAKIKALDQTDIAVSCTTLANDVSSVKNLDHLTLQWNATMTLVGDREQYVREFSGTCSEQAGQCV